MICQEVDEDCISHLTNQAYIKNVSTEALLQDFQYKIPIEKFICYCIGNVKGRKSIQCLRILKKTPSEKITTMFVEWFHPTHKKQTIQFWVGSGVSLKKFFFLHEDQLNFFRSTFIYYPELCKFFRLASIQNFLEIMEINPMGKFIFSSPIKCHGYKRRIEIDSGKQSRKRKKDFVKGVKYFIKKYNVDNYISTYELSLMQELRKICPEIK